MKKQILLSLVLLAGVGTATAQVRQRSLGIELGSHNAAVYDLTLGRHFSVTAKAGLVLEAGFSGKKDVNGKRFSFGGFTPFASLEPRWHFSGESASDLFHTGGYLGVRLNGAWDRATIFGPSYPKGYDRPLYTLGFSPRFGWVFGVNENSYIGLSAGLEFFRTKMSYNEGGSPWRTPRTEGVIPVSLEMTYGIRF
ncbi:MAG: hypothetical protein ACFN22_05060 [Porphyromonas pasteri]